MNGTALQNTWTSIRNTNTYDTNSAVGHSTNWHGCNPVGHQMASCFLCLVPVLRKSGTIPTRWAFKKASTHCSRWVPIQTKFQRRRSQLNGWTKIWSVAHMYSVTIQNPVVCSCRLAVAFVLVVSAVVVAICLPLGVCESAVQLFKFKQLGWGWGGQGCIWCWLVS